MLLPMNLQTLIIPEGTIAGADIAYPGWTGCKHKYPNTWSAKGKDGIRFVGSGDRGTHLKVPKNKPASLVISRNAGIVVIENMTIHAGEIRAVVCAPEGWHAATPIAPRIIFRDCEFVEANSMNPARWLIDGYQFDLEIEHCDFWGINLSEHDIYQRNTGPLGTRIVDTHFHGAGGECYKKVARPAQQYYPPDDPLHNYPSNCDQTHPMPMADTVIQNCTFENWGRKQSSVPQGGGIVLQGTAQNAAIEKCTFKADEQGDGPCIGIDDGGRRHFGWKSRVAGETPANGLIGVSECILFSYGPRSMVFVGGDPINDAKRIVEGIQFKRCGFYQGAGPSTRIDIHTPNTHSFRQCNTPEVEAVAQSLGFDTSRPVAPPVTP
jgi:hypothetical protein